MDRRPVIGFALIFVMIIGYSLLMNKMYPKPLPSKPEAAATTPAAATPAAAETAPVTSPAAAATGIGQQVADPLAPVAPLTMAEMLQPVPAADGSTIITVTTPLYRARIDTRGGAVVGWELLEHKAWQGGAVQLVPKDAPADGGDAVLFRAAQLDLSMFPYTADGGDLQLAAGSGKRTLVLKGATRGGLEVRKIYTFDPAVYGVTVDIELGGDGAAVGNMLVQTGAADAVRFGWNHGIAPIERRQKLEEAALRSFVGVGEDIHFRKRQSMKKDVTKVEGQWRGSARFAGLQDRYFTIIGIVPKGQGGPVEGTVRIGGNRDRMAQTWAIELPARSNESGAIAASRLELYIGPQQAELLHVYGQGLEKTMDMGWKWVRPLSTLVLKGMELLYRVIPNYGVVIIIFSVLTKLMFYPLTKTSTESMKKMAELQPKMKALQEKYKNDKEKLNQATLKLYQEEKVNPLSGCLPLLVQSPVFIALYQALSRTISLRGQPFFGWMSDLSQPDSVMTLSFLGGADLNILPFLMGIAMYYQTKFTPNTGGGQMAAMNTMMPVIMVFIFYNMPSGLVLYWLVNNVMQAYQSWQIHRAASKSGGVATA